LAQTAVTMPGSAATADAGPLGIVGRAGRRVGPG